MTQHFPIRYNFLIYCSTKMKQTSKRTNSIRKKNWHTNKCYKNELLFILTISMSSMPYFVQNVEIKSMANWISGGNGESCALFNILCNARGIRGTIFINSGRDCAEHRICDKTLTVFGRTTGIISDKNRNSITDSAISIKSPYFRRSYVILCVRVCENQTDVRRTDLFFR